MIKSSPDLSLNNVDLVPHAISLGLGDFVKNAHIEQTTLEAKLLKDTTKTKAARQLFSYEAADKRLKQIWDKLEKKQKEITGGLYQLGTKLDNELKINGTTDLVILNSYVPILQTMKILDITELARSGDKDAIRATLLVPALRLTANSGKRRTCSRKKQSGLFSVMNTPNCKPYVSNSRMLKC